MKTSKKLIYLFLVIPVVVIGILVTSCSKNDDVSKGGEPVVSYVRVNDPDKSDSLLAAGLLGNLVVIVGQNLANTREIWFNDQQAVLNPTYITNTNIMVAIPNAAPVDITNKIKLVFANGKTLLYDFAVSIPAPVVAALDNEYTPQGDSVIIIGDYFFDQTPIEVNFTGAASPATVILVTKTEMQVVVPDDATEGPVTVTTHFGSTTSFFRYKDSRNLIWTADADPFQGWWGGGGNGGAVVVQPGGSPNSVNGNYEFSVASAIDGSNWTEIFGGPASAIGDLATALPQDAILDPSSYALKFEINTIKPYPAAEIMRIRFGEVASPPDWSASYGLPGPIDTKGKWQTISIPFNQVIAPMTDLKVSSSGYGVKFWYWNPDGSVITPGVNVEIAIDNVRVVPINK